MNTDIPDNPTAFPYERTKSKGMELRDYFAAKSIEGYLGMKGIQIESPHIKAVAQKAYEIADAMLKAREENK